MPANRKPKAWNLKPQLTAAPELWRGETIVLPMWEGVGLIYNVGSSRIYQKTPEAGSYLWSNTPLGRAIKLPGTAEIYFGDADEPLKATSSTEFTAVSLHRASSIPNNEGLFATRDAGGDNGKSFFRYDSAGFAGGASNTIKFGMGSDTGSVSGEAEGGVQTTEIQHIALRWRSGNAPELFVDGRKQTPTASPGTLGGTLGGDTFFGWGIGININGGYWSGDILLSVGTTAYWTDEEIAEHARDPFAMLRPAGF